MSCGDHPPPPREVEAEPVTGNGWRETRLRRHAAVAWVPEEAGTMVIPSLSTCSLACCRSMYGTWEHTHAHRRETLTPNSAMRG